MSFAIARSHVSSYDPTLLESADVDRELAFHPSGIPDGVDDGAGSTGGTTGGWNDQAAFNGKAVLFLKGKGDRNEIDFDDVNQEALADCYLLGCLASLAKEDPGAIKKMISAKKDGTYDVTLYKRDGAGTLQPQVENVDPRSFSIGAAGPGDVSGSKKEIWGMVIEKAFAQMKGGYDAIANGGSWEEGMETLTGRESSTFNSAALSFGTVEQALKKDQPVVINTVQNSGTGVNAALTNLNLVGWHTYAIVDAKTDKGEQWVKLFNPWGNQAASQPGVDPKDRKSDGGWVKYSDLVAANIWQGTAIGEGTRALRG
jgi:hypothetical protein